MEAIKKAEIYTDGSYNKDIKGITRGGVVILFNDEPYAFIQIVTKRNIYVSQWNIGGELIAAQFGLNMALNEIQQFKAAGLEIPDCLDVYHDWVGINDLVRPNPSSGNVFKSQKDGCVFYKNFFKELGKRYPTQINFWWIKSHSGNKWNEVVDELAKGYWPMGPYDKVIRKEITF